LKSFFEQYEEVKSNQWEAVVIKVNSFKMIFWKKYTTKKKLRMLACRKILKIS
jgi:hypothetical protein